MAAEMQSGLSSDQASKLKMLCTPIESLPTGDELGLFYGLDLGKTSVRIMRVQLGGQDARIVKQEVVEVPIPCELMVGSSEELFEYIARELAKFVATEYEAFPVIAVRRKELGFTILFPIDQRSGSSGTIIEWPKGFAIKDTVGKDAVTEINEAMERNGVDMRVFALVNDTVGALAEGRYISSDVVASVILGVGANAAYVELAHAVPKWHGPLPNSGHMVINMEWGNFHSSHLPVTEFDIRLDAESSNPGEQIFEKLISGMHLGEIVRRVLLKMAEDIGLFGDTIPPKLRIPFVLRTPDMAAMHQDTSENLEMAGEKMKDVFGIQASNLMMRKIVINVCRVVAERGAHLVAAGIVGILKMIGRERLKERSVVVVDGSLYEHYRCFRECLHGSVTDMLRTDGCHENVIIEHLNSGIGAALIAAAHSKDTQNY
ncbi:hexokinase-1-like [Magnolia sinica]|uniref:hexokinase-1-like n=1 Tax=Magnolia sinica TaxID=86752 RepID=UPI0026581763|nr:hexokinase-1-like [Magnolia sinica]